MAVTLTEQKVVPIGESEALVFGTVLMDSSYATGGEAIDAPGDLGYHHLVVGSNGGYVGSWDATNQKVLAYRSAGSAAAMGEVPNATDLSAVTFPIVGYRPA